MFKSFLWNDWAATTTRFHHHDHDQSLCCRQDHPRAKHKSHLKSCLSTVSDHPVAFHAPCINLRNGCLSKSIWSKNVFVKRSAIHPSHDQSLCCRQDHQRAKHETLMTPHNKTGATFCKTLRKSTVSQPIKYFFSCLRTYIYSVIPQYLTTPISFR